jgi:hypothetical protein
MQAAVLDEKEQCTPFVPGSQYVLLEEKRGPGRFKGPLAGFGTDSGGFAKKNFGQTPIRVTPFSK